MTEDLLNRALLATVGALIAACVGVFVRLRQLEAKRAAADVRLAHLEKRGSSAPAVKELAERVERNEKALADHRLESERRFLTRNDWVPVMSTMLGKLERQGEAIARIEECLRIREKAE